MRTIVVILLVVLLMCGFALPTFASDWDVAGKVLTGVEGLRILTRGKIDIVGNMAGLDRGKKEYHHDDSYRENCRRVWVPEYVWEKRWIPTHREYDEKLGEIIVEGHYIKYKVQRGGHWENDH